MPRFALVCLYAGLSFVHASQPCQGDECNVMVNSLLQSSHRETKMVHSTKATISKVAQQSAPSGYTQVATNVEYCHSGTVTVKDGVDSKPTSHSCCQFGWDSYKNGGNADVGTQKGVDVCNENSDCRYISRTDGGWTSLSKDCTPGDLKVGVYTIFVKNLFVCPSGWTRTAALTPFELGTNTGNGVSDCGCQNGCSGVPCTNKCADGGTGDKCPTVDQAYQLTDSNAGLYCTQNSMLQIEEQAHAPAPVLALLEQCEPPTCRKGERACPDANDPPNYCPICVAEDVPCAPLFACGKGKKLCLGTETCVPVGKQCDGGALTQQAAVAREANTKTMISEVESKSNKTTRKSCSDWWLTMHAICETENDNDPNFININVDKWEFKYKCCVQLPAFYNGIEADCSQNTNWSSFWQDVQATRITCYDKGVWR